MRIRFFVLLLTLFAATDAYSKEWTCVNRDLEISCVDQKCSSSDSFTRWSVDLGEDGAISVCAYSGCWEGKGKVLSTEDFLVIVAHQLPFSSSPSSEPREDIALALGLKDSVATIKAGAFAMPLTCTLAKK